MIPYLIFLVIVLFTSKRLNKDIKENKNTNLTFVLLLLILVSFSGLRNFTVGTDTASYVRFFLNFEYKNTGWKLTWEELLNDEGAFTLLAKIITLFTDQYWVFLSFIAILAYLPVLISIKNNSSYVFISIFFFIMLGYYNFSFNAARQGIAAGIYMLSYKYILEKDFRKYALIVIIAMMFHKTIIVALPLYFLFTKKFSVKTVSIIIISTLIISYFMTPLLSMGATLEDRYRLYTTTSNKGAGQYLALFYLLLAIYFIYQRKYIEIQYKKWYDVCLNMLMCASAIYIMVILNGVYIELTRFAFYFQLSSIFLWAELFIHRTKKYNTITKNIIFLGSILYFMIFISKMGGYTPYIFNKSIF